MVVAPNAPSSRSVRKEDRRQLFRHIDNGRLGELLEPLPAQLGAEAGLLHAGERRVGPEVEMLIDVGNR